jgi:hypothetical protein
MKNAMLIGLILMLAACAGASSLRRSAFSQLPGDAQSESLPAAPEAPEAVEAVTSSGP